MKKNSRNAFLTVFAVATVSLLLTTGCQNNGEQPKPQEPKQEQTKLEQPATEHSKSDQPKAEHPSH
jgi:hypothetical protein